ELLRIHSKSQYVASAQEKINRCETMLRDKEKYIADFYFKTKVYDAARFRYLDILANFREPQLIEHAAVRVLEASAKLNEPNACQTYYKSFMVRMSPEGRERLTKTLEQCQSQE